VKDSADLRIKRVGSHLSLKAGSARLSKRFPSQVARPAACSA